MSALHGNDTFKPNLIFSSYILLKFEIDYKRNEMKLINFRFKSIGMKLNETRYDGIIKMALI